MQISALKEILNPKNVEGGDFKRLPLYPFSQIKLDGDFREYAKDDSSDFMQGFLGHVIPHVAK